MEHMNLYDLWCEKAVADSDVVAELKAIAGDDTKIEDAFYRNLAFGTGGLVYTKKAQRYESLGLFTGSML